MKKNKNLKLIKMIKIKNCFMKKSLIILKNFMSIVKNIKKINL